MQIKKYYARINNVFIIYEKVQIVMGINTTKDVNNNIGGLKNMRKEKITKTNKTKSLNRRNNVNSISSNNCSFINISRSNNKFSI